MSVTDRLRICAICALALSAAIAFLGWHDVLVGGLPLWAVLAFLAAWWTVGTAAHALWPGADAAMHRAHMRGNLGDLLVFAALYIGILLRWTFFR